jgi:hypothetical protein
MTSSEVHVDTDPLYRVGTSWKARAADYRFPTDQPPPPGDGNWSSHQGVAGMDGAMGQAGDHQHDQLHRNGEIAQGAATQYSNTDQQQAQNVNAAGAHLSTSDQKDLISTGTGALKDLLSAGTSGLQAGTTALSSAASSGVSAFSAAGNSLASALGSTLQSVNKMNLDGMAVPGAAGGAHTAGMGAAPDIDKGQDKDHKDREGHRDERTR